MGHYYGEMMCPDCGEIRCCCPDYLEKKRKWARMSDEEKKSERLQTLFEVIEEAEKMRNERSKKTRVPNKKA